MVIQDAAVVLSIWHLYFYSRARPGLARAAVVAEGLPLRGHSLWLAKGLSHHGNLKVVRVFYIVTGFKKEREAACSLKTLIGSSRCYYHHIFFKEGSDKDKDSIHLLMGGGKELMIARLFTRDVFQIFELRNQICAVASK